ncbi:hypothetical protein SANTM175S_00842 [Streptomyces antimycoticus]
MRQDHGHVRAGLVHGDHGLLRPGERLANGRPELFALKGLDPDAGDAGQFGEPLRGRHSDRPVG